MGDDSTPHVPLLVQAVAENPDDIDPASNPARWTYYRLAKEIQEFEDDLSSEEEIGARLVGTPGISVFHIDDVGYWGPDMIVFYGTNEHGKPIKLIQHCNQLSVILTALPISGPEPRRIGFHLASRAQEGVSETAKISGDHTS